MRLTVKFSGTPVILPKGSLCCVITIFVDIEMAYDSLFKTKLQLQALNIVIVYRKHLVNAVT